MNSKKFVLVLEERPNSFDPINWNDNNIYDLETIDIFTSNYSEEEFRSFLVENNMIDEISKYAPLQIIYNDNGIRRLNTGLLYKEDYIDNMNLYINMFIENNINNTNLLNEIIQKIINEKSISSYAKDVFVSIFNNRKNTDNLKYSLNRLCDCSYTDIRNAYIYIIRVQEFKSLNNNKLILNKKSDEK